MSATRLCRGVAARRLPCSTLLSAPAPRTCHHTDHNPLLLLPQFFAHARGQRRYAGAAPTSTTNASSPPNDADDATAAAAAAAASASSADAEAEVKATEKPSSSSSADSSSAEGGEGAGAKAKTSSSSSSSSSDAEEGKLSTEELEEMRERQRWQDRYEFSDAEIEEELAGEKAYKERWRAAKTWMRYHFNIFEEHDNLTERRERWTVLHWRDVRVWKYLIGMGLLSIYIWGDWAKEKFFKKVQEFQERGGGADWPTYYITMSEIKEGRRSMDEILLIWEKIRESHQRDWLLPLLAAQALMHQVGDPPVLSQGAPPDGVVDRLTEELMFIEADVGRMSAEIALHLHNLLSGDVKWPGRPPNEAVKKEMTDTVQQMSNFRIHPVLQARLVQQAGQSRNFYGGNGYFKTSASDLQAKAVTSV